MKKKGFTLVELLAVIVILAIIALIAIPLIGNVIEKAKIGALESSVNGLVESANMYYANETIKGGTISETIFDFEDGEQISTQKLEYKGKVYNGKLILHASGEVAVCIDDTEHYAYKNKDTNEIVSGIGTCLYDGTTGDFSSNSSINDLRGKTLVATNVSESADGLNTLIKIPEEGHYDENSIISVSNDILNNKSIFCYFGATSAGTANVWFTANIRYKNNMESNGNKIIIPESGTYTLYTSVFADGGGRFRIYKNDVNIREFVNTQDTYTMTLDKGDTIYLTSQTDGTATWGVIGSLLVKNS